MNVKETYLRFLAIAYIISAAHTPFFFRLGWASCLYMFFVSGFVFGTTFFLLGLISAKIRMRSFFVQILVQTVLIGINIAVSMSIIAVVGASIFSKTSVLNPELYRQLIQFIQPGLAAAAISLGLFLAFVINSISAVSQKLGPGVLWNWMTGKYYSPREEQLVVMFLDMKDSTTIAEKLGSLQFSALVRDFFADLTGPLTSTGARVSHYIGDEAVIYWYPQAAAKKSACLRLVPAFRKVLESKSADYVRKYGFVPEFKAGAHMGMVVATEVGEVKSEVVFHGDAVNTTARIQGLCGEEGEDFLISGELAEFIGSSSEVVLESLGSRTVKGRAKEVAIFAVKESMH